MEVETLFLNKHSHFCFQITMPSIKRKSLIIKILFLLGFSIYSFAQENDKIYLLSKEVVEGKILRVTADHIEINPSGNKPFLKINRDNVSVIIYNDNTVVNFNESKNIKTTSITEEEADEGINENHDKTISVKKEGEYFPKDEKEVLGLAKKHLNKIISEAGDIEERPNVPYSFPSLLTKEYIKKNKIKIITTKYSQVVPLVTPTLYRKHIETWEYDQNGNLIQELETINEKIESKDRYEYDFQERIIKKKRYSSGGLLGGERTEIAQYKYSGDTTFIREFYRKKLSYLTINYKNISVSISPKYKSVGTNVTKKYGHKYIEKSFYKSEKETPRSNTYEYQYKIQNGRLLEYYNGYFKYVTDFKYDKNDRLIKISEHKKSEKGTYKISYNSKGLIKKTDDSYYGVRAYEYEFYD
ncbi:hypothetical protein VOI54_17050 [Tamlana sp. 2201CG12-4]|uniref:hypothetical protein n=1 Tax=Tamlana sp. 2201CG12-4 TaxID=3112582 RepID=UPI002DBE880C|nr:hypothetical protein [Tamlana sp. 2201CG12-4]MEC3908738.1 hypothetical protein [Tamlana sp. 2201CG12-4]